MYLRSLLPSVPSSFVFVFAWISCFARETVFYFFSSLLVNSLTTLAFHLHSNVFNTMKTSWVGVLELTLYGNMPLDHQVPHYRTKWFVINPVLSPSHPDLGCVLVCGEGEDSRSERGSRAYKGAGCRSGGGAASRHVAEAEISISLSKVLLERSAWIKHVSSFQFAGSSVLLLQNNIYSINPFICYKFQLSTQEV